MILVQRWRGVLVFAAVGAGVLVYVLSASNSSSHGRFVPVPISLAVHSLFDMGVTDVNGDQFLDIYTSNHASPQSVLIGNGERVFTDIFEKMHLDQDPHFPGLTEPNYDPQLTSPGLYIYWKAGKLVVRANGLTNFDPIRGQVSMLSSVTIDEDDQFEVDVQEVVMSDSESKSVVEFSASGNGFVELVPRLGAQPISFTIDDAFPLDSIYVGHRHVSPNNHAFRILVGDRHGMAWADYDGDGRNDLFIVRGGLRGMLGDLPITLYDELFVRSDSGFTNHAEALGFRKEGCSGRSVAWIDYNQDDLLDLYVVCGTVNELQANQLHKRLPDGTFMNVAREVGVDIPSEGSMIWLDFDNDGDADLFWAERSDFFLYENDDGVFARELISSGAANSPRAKLTAADFDRDGDLDVFSASVFGNALFENDGNGFSYIEPSTLGLPSSSLTANWVDFDNDGAMDLHTIPGGLFRQVASDRFEKDTDFPELPPTPTPLWKLELAIAAWFDSDNDGYRDAIMAIGHGEKQEAPYKWVSAALGWLRFDVEADVEVSFYRNLPGENHWLEVELTGSEGNRPAIGSRVNIVSEAGRQMQFVGQAEGSHYSQGHRRLYFGLGPDKSVDTLRVTWADGAVLELENVPADRLMTVVKDTSRHS